MHDEVLLEVHEGKCKIALVEIVSEEFRRTDRTETSFHSKEVNTREINGCMQELIAIFPCGIESFSIESQRLVMLLTKI